MANLHHPSPKSRTHSRTGEQIRVLRECPITRVGASHVAKIDASMGVPTQLSEMYLFDAENPKLCRTLFPLTSHRRIPTGQSARLLRTIYFPRHKLRASNVRGD